ncbi:hypothetical protein POM88_045390 [Heracleum sosnowskyi]|uniref:Uncharacterized protein n=1 Tax=Heracleum sosnowskyi TaxID=360622 RepID=A0AAD8M4W7_9APIA|nr:hypothetical protein POM88_045390 [Heracleum sosnowskyi]
MGKRVREDNIDVVDDGLPLKKFSGEFVSDAYLAEGLGSLKWRLTGFYSWHEGHNRHFSWKLLAELAGEVTGPWVCIVDFNEILFDAGKKGSRYSFMANGELQRSCGFV